MIYTGKNNEYLHIETIVQDNCIILKEQIPESLMILWFTSDNNSITIDNIEFKANKSTIIFLTEFHKLEINKINEVQLIRFNRAFFCIANHDSEVGCKGILFFGASQVPAFMIPSEELEKFTILLGMFEMELDSKDNLQLEMLEVMLKRFLILCTRIYKEQKQIPNFKQLDMIREFNYLVEKHFKSYHRLADYDTLMNKSSKTLSNYFSKVSDKTPHQLIQERIMLEARRTLIYTDLSIKEITYEIGFEDIQTFSRFFKNNEGVSPSEFREKSVMGKIVNT